MSNLQEASDLENNISISARRFEESPYIERTNSPDMIRGVYAGRYFAIYNGETIRRNTGVCGKRLCCLMHRKSLLKSPALMLFLFWTKFSPAQSRT